ncbi:family 78 glycoside hydrolase catalytic domain [Pedobacter duraquae]|uniref:alpha-L-rhamnosidase n=1 Tax=Pedobacter duraquae TaxID=425511 RepID=A0A4R6IAR1_9SPHI|nr:family 78 glycoside hydrolase catalytic domain [Pedobacter duraquae]TDO19303.1 alpha-L-rhamnosidase-like protein [Pedobacter duraquae]
MFKNATLFFIAILLNVQLFAQKTTVLAPKGLMCDLIAAKSKPANDKAVIFNKNPGFSWEQNKSGQSLKQTAYQLLVSDNLMQLNKDIGTIWNSGKISSSNSSAVLFKGAALAPGKKYYWKVRIWNGQSVASAYSSAASFMTSAELSDYKNPSYPLQITGQKPVSIKTIDSFYQADFGKDAFAQLKMELFSKTAGDTVVIRLGETLDQEGNINRKPPGTIRYARYVLTLKKGLHTYKINLKKDAFNTKPAAMKMPDYIGEVTPFRYCEVEGYALPLDKNTLTRLFVHYPFDDHAASFHSSDPTLNAIWDLCKYAIKATSFLGIYVDGDRERIPYEADAYINQLSHYAVDKEFTMARNSHEYLITHPTWPTEWNLQSVLMAWNDYLYTGDSRSIAHYYKDLQAKTLVSLTDSTGLISTLNGRLTDEVKASIHRGNGALKDIVDWPLNTETDGFVFTKYNAVVNAFHYRSLIIMEQIATDLGKATDAEMYRNKAANVKVAFHKMFFDSNRKVFVDGIGTDHASLHANAFALALGLVDSKDVDNVLAFIKSRGMACSVYGSQFLLDGIYDAQDSDYGLSLLTSKTDRSWFNMLRVGSTITLEAWDNKYKPNQDWNHAWGAAPANIISRKLMGIAPITPGWTSFVIKPQIGTLKEAQITVPTIKGTILAAYQQTRDWFIANIEIPGNTTPKIYLPLKNGSPFKVFLDGKLVKAQQINRTAFVEQVGSGKHTLKIVYLN